jgi:hypothetical protein
MQKKEVPQESGLLNGHKEIAYAVDEQGRYILVPTEGWSTKHDVNEVAWEEICEELEETRQRALAGEVSPLAFHACRHLMDLPLLADYMGLSRWRVRRHMHPRRFQRLNATLLQRYADLFHLTTEQLQTVPHKPTPPASELQAPPLSSPSPEPKNNKGTLS